MTKLIYSAKTEEDLIYQPEICQWNDEGHVIALTQESHHTFATGRVTEHLKQNFPPPEAYVFICGPIPLAKSVLQILLQGDHPKEQIFVSLPYEARQAGPIYRADHPKLR